MDTPPPARGPNRLPYRTARVAVPFRGMLWATALTFLLVVGLVKAINLLVLLAYLMLAALALNALAAGWAIHGLTARRRVLGPAVAGEPCAVEVLLTAPPGGRRGVGVEDVGPAHQLTWFAVRLGGEEAFHGRVVLPRRGRYPWGPVVAVSGYPFGLVLRRTVLAPGEDVLVLPRAGRLHRGRFRRLLLGGAFEQDRVRRQPRLHPAAQDQFHGLRPFRPGDSPRHIHWRTTARRGQRMVREFEDLPGDTLVLVFDPAAPPSHLAAAAGRRPFEQAVSLAAAVAAEWRRDTGDRLIAAFPGDEPVVFDGPAGPGLTRRVLEQLAVVEPRPAGAPAGEAALLGRLHDLPPAAVVVVSAAGGRLAGVLEKGLGRPVVSLEGASVGKMDFYTPPM
jgi:uncharacterized protein (DUF58 family)